MERAVAKREFEHIKAVLVNAGFNTTLYKDSFMRRRIEAAFRRSRAESHDEYVKMLQQSPEALKGLKKAFSIGVTRFFRNLDTFNALKQHYLPQLIVQKRQRNDLILKMWSVGCSTGAEPYTFAILLSQLLSESPVGLSVRITGTDYNPILLEVAEKGFYPESSMEEVPPLIRKLYFTKDVSGLYQISPEIQQMVHFRLHELLKDPPLKGLDVIVCRNVLIYFSQQSQQKIFEEFANALNFHGLLILGRTEILPPHYRSKFKILDSKHKVYQKLEKER